MKRNFDDLPEFFKTINSEYADSIPYKVNPKSSTEKFDADKYNTIASNQRMTETLHFCFKASIWIAILAVLIIVGDALFQYFNLESSVLKDAFSLISYIVTAALGYMFAIQNQK